ncbi:hypothetical protein AYI68_g5456 [Smittium mucronatum]|uniref:Uncharacterized protein n=1 Tax=Smittium mucronatum TaxID=133383 RepID=A0A1R0GR87_9FUNG|nr:hypothetical protein AYI68_g6523 [Smittium mucronatum]OLY80449.1 hypothetical protein AYI68_g5456 [Smittium mucronatum]
MKVAFSVLAVLGSCILSAFSMENINENADAVLKRDSGAKDGRGHGRGHGRISRHGRFGHRGHRGYYYGNRYWYWRERPDAVFIRSLKFVPSRYCDQRFQYLYVYNVGFRRSWDSDVLFRRRWVGERSFRRNWFGRVNYRGWRRI